MDVGGSRRGFPWEASGTEAELNVRKPDLKGTCCALGANHDIAPHHSASANVHDPCKGFLCWPTTSMVSWLWLALIVSKLP